MSDHTEAAQETDPTAVAERAHGPIVPEMHFDESELAAFDDEDTAAGRAICVMLSLFFAYTVFAMAAVAWWTFAVTPN